MRPFGRLARPTLNALASPRPTPGPSQPNITPTHSTTPSSVLRPHTCIIGTRLLSTTSVRNGGPGSGPKPGCGPRRKGTIDPAAVDSPANLAVDDLSLAADPAEAEASSDEVTGQAADDVLPGSSSFRLRPYQLDCIEAVLQARRVGYTRIGVSAPTGSGKTAIFTSLIHRLSEIQYSDGGHNARRVMILVGAIELAHQAMNTIKRRFPDLVVEIEQGAKNKATGYADVTVATYQTLMSGGRLDKFDSREYKAVIVDEAHHAAAKSYLTILAHFNSHVRQAVDSSTVMEAKLVAQPITSSDAVDSRSAASTSDHTLDSDHPPEPVVEGELDEAGRPIVPVLGFTATFGRADGLALGKVFEMIAWHSDWIEMIKGKWLSQLQFTTVRLGDALDLSKVDVASSGEFNQTSLAAQVDRPEVTDLAVEAWLSKARNRRSTIVFAINIKHIHSIVDHFKQAGVDARCVHEKVRPREREATLLAFRAGEFPVLVNCGILTEGADFPAVDCVLMARPTRSANLFIQMLGRGLRLSPDTGKTNCLVLDLVGSSVQGLACTPTLFGVDPDQAIEDRSTDQLIELAEERPAARPEEAGQQSAEASAAEFEVEYKDYSIFDLVESESPAGGGGHEAGQTLTARTMRSQSRNAWIGVGGGKFVLELRGNYISVDASPDQIGMFRAQFHKRQGAHYQHSMYLKPKLIGTHHSLAVMLRTADAYAREVPSANSFNIDLRRGAKWRAGAMSDSQRIMLTARLRNHLVEIPGAVGLEERQKLGIEGVWLGRGWKELIDIDTLTKGEAADVLTRALHGAIPVVTSERMKMETRARKEEKALAKRKQKEEKQREKALQRAAKQPAPLFTPGFLSGR